HWSRTVRFLVARLVAFDVHHRRRATHRPLHGDCGGVLLSPRLADARRRDALRAHEGEARAPRAGTRSRARDRHRGVVLRRVGGHRGLSALLAHARARTVRVLPDRARSARARDAPRVTGAPIIARTRAIPAGLCRCPAVEYTVRVA